MLNLMKKEGADVVKDLELTLDPNVCYFGLELEFYSPDLKKNEEELNKLFELFKQQKLGIPVEEDELGGELVTTPMTLNEVTQFLDDWGNHFFSLTGDIVDTEECGLHIHISKAKIPNLEEAYSKIIQDFRKSPDWFGGHSPHAFLSNFEKAHRPLLRGRQMIAVRQETLEIRLFRATKSVAKIKEYINYLDRFTA